MKNLEAELGEYSKRAGSEAGYEGLVCTTSEAYNGPTSIKYWM